jgi:YHS domain-containing protein
MESSTLRTRPLALCAFVLFALAAVAQNKNLVNVNKDGAALQGHDPVAFFTQNKPVKGIAGIQSTYKGARYYFATLENKKKFEADPAKYEPQFGGYCAYGVSKGDIYPIEVDAFQIVDGRLLMQYNKDARDEFNKDTQGRLKKADANWPGIVEKKGR